MIFFLIERVIRFKVHRTREILCINDKYFYQKGEGELRVYINKLIKVYNENFSFWYRAKESFHRSKIIVFPLILLSGSTFCFYSLFFKSDIPFKYLLMICSILFFILSIIWASTIQKKSIKSKYGTMEKYEIYKLESVEHFLRIDLNIAKIEQYALLDSLVRKEIEEIEESRLFPFINTIRQLIIAVLITGLLSYSLKQIAEGDSALGQSLLVFYIMIIGTIIILSSIIYSNREFTKKYKLKQISKLICELQLKSSLIDSNLQNVSKKKRKQQTR